MQTAKETALSQIRCMIYDANGNLTNDGAGKAYTWDARNHLVSVTQGNNVTGFVYDGFGRRVQETFNGTVTKQWVWSGMVRPCEERDGSNNVTKRFYSRGEQINGTNYFFALDHLGSVREMTDSSGNLVARYDYDPYGRRTLVSGTDMADFGFTRFYYDQATGLDLTWFRAYDPNLGRWLNRDPIGERGGINLYGYVANNPIVRVDAFGLEWSWGGLGSAAGHGAASGVIGGVIVGAATGETLSWATVTIGAAAGAVGEVGIWAAENTRDSIFPSSSTTCSVDNTPTIYVDGEIPTIHVDGDDPPVIHVDDTPTITPAPIVPILPPIILHLPASFQGNKPNGNTQ